MNFVAFEHAFEYPFDARGTRVPALRFRVSSPPSREQGVDVFAALDTGAERSIFVGELAPAIGLDLLGGRTMEFRSAAGLTVATRLHKVRFEHEVLEPMELEVAFSTGALSRNLLGRDFFELFQVGFREQWMEFYLSQE